MSQSKRIAAFPDHSTAARIGGRWILFCRMLSCAFVLGSGICGAAVAEFSSASTKAPADPIRCAGPEELVLENRSIVTDGHAVEIIGSCDIEIRSSHIVAGGTAILVRGSGDVRVVDSFVQGNESAALLMGSGDLIYRSSTFRGGLRKLGTGDLIDEGGNTIEVIPNALDERGRIDEFSCSGSQLVSWIGVRLDEDLPIEIAGECELLISDSQLGAGGIALTVRDRGAVRVRNSTIDGEMILRDAAASHIAGSYLGALVVQDEARWTDGGGNSLAAQGARAASNPVSARPRAVRTERRGGADGGPCRLALEADPVLLVNTVASRDLGRQYLVCAGNGATVTGDALEVVLAAGGAGVVSGDGNILHVDSGASVSLSGRGNTVYLYDGGTVSGRSGNQVVQCGGMTPPEMDWIAAHCGEGVREAVEEGVGTALEALGGLAGALSGKPDGR